MFEYLGTLIGMHQVDGIISSAQAEAILTKTSSGPNGSARPGYRVPRDQRFEAIRKRFEQQRLKRIKTPPIPTQICGIKTGLISPKMH
jgi:hypothetical protein